MRKILYFLGHLTDEDVEWLASHGTRQEYGDGVCLTEEDQPVTHMAILLQGSAEVLINQGRKVIATVGAGEMIGEVSLVDAHPASATVRCHGSLLCLRLAHADMRRKFETDTAFAARFYKAITLLMAERMRAMVKQLGDKNTRGTFSLLEEQEIDDTLLDQVHMAGNRFHMILNRLAQR